VSFVASERTFDQGLLALGGAALLLVALGGAVVLALARREIQGRLV
jgi:hypothetical protein